MGWENISLSYKILYLKELMQNCSDGTFNKSDIYTVDALITGSRNTYSGELSFEFSKSHMNFLESAWDLAVKYQRDNSILYFIKKEIQKK
jgi:hypothetical protein